MRFRLDTSYDASPEEVFAMITDITFQGQVFERLRVHSYDVVVGDAGDDLRVRFQWQTQASDVPVVARRFVGNTLELAQVKVWHRPDANGAREADVPDGEVTGVPVKELDATALERIDSFGKLIGPPWTEDQKYATVAALTALARG